MGWEQKRWSSAPYSAAIGEALGYDFGEFADASDRDVTTVAERVDFLVEDLGPGSAMILLRDRRDGRFIFYAWDWDAEWYRGVWPRGTDRETIKRDVIATATYLRSGADVRLGLSSLEANAYQMLLSQYLSWALRQSVRQDVVRVVQNRVASKLRGLHPRNYPYLWNSGLLKNSTWEIRPSRKPSESTAAVSV